jgi:hypothetical protein
MKTLYGKITVDGVTTYPVAEMDGIDALRTVKQHGNEWSNDPWPKSEPAAAAPAEKPVLKMPEPAAAAKT